MDAFLAFGMNFVIFGVSDIYIPPRALHEWKEKEAYRHYLRPREATIAMM